MAKKENLKKKMFLKELKKWNNLVITMIIIIYGSVFLVNLDTGPCGSEFCDPFSKSIDKSWSIATLLLLIFEMLIYLWLIVQSPNKINIMELIIYIIIGMVISFLPFMLIITSQDIIQGITGVLKLGTINIVIPIVVNLLLKEANG